MIWKFIKSIFSIFFKEEKKSEPVPLNEAPLNHTALEDMTKAELDALGKHHGMKLDRRRKKAQLVQDLKDNNIFY